MGSSHCFVMVDVAREHYCSYHYCSCYHSHYFGLHQGDKLRTMKTLWVLSDNGYDCLYDQMQGLVL